jgi:TRAP-type C4-dicarboxylate transport system permease small subunit
MTYIIKGLDAVNSALRKVIPMICGISVIAIFLVVIIQVFFRYVLRMSLSGAEELPTYIMAICCWVSVPVAAMDDSHVNIDLVPNLFKGRGRIIFSIWAELIEVLTMSFFTKLAWDYTAHMVEEGTVTGGLAMPMWIFYAVIIFGSVTCALFGLINLIRNLWRIIKWEQS